MKYPIGVQDFEGLIKDGYVYVDKTDLVYRLVNDGKIYFLSRPRRFGKSLLVSTLKHYFLGHRELFKGLAIDGLETEWNEYPVFHLSFGGVNFSNSSAIDESLSMFIENAEKEYGIEERFKDYGIRFAAVLKAAHERTGRRCVVLIDEYDKPLLDVMDTELRVTDSDGNSLRLEEYNRNVLKGFYSVFKDADPDLKFVLLTGVTKFSQVSVFSGFNQPKDISMDSRYEALCGITLEEMLEVFHEPITELAKKYKTDYDGMVEMLRKRYDGYHFSSEMTGVFNPFSLLNCFNKLEMRNYWFATGTPTYLMRLLSHSDKNINELVGRYYEESQFIDYKADVERPLPMIYQSGYLTVKEYDIDTRYYLLDFPNEEVRSGFIDMLASSYFSSGEMVSSWIFDVNRDLRGGKIEDFMRKMTSLLSSVTYRFQRKQDAFECERYFQYTFYLIMQMIGHYNTMVEKETSEGRIDCVVECPDYVYVMEFKMDGSAQSALEQIRERGYTKPYLADKRKVFSIGVNFSSEKGTIEEYLFE
ncbi:MAG: AAA family ATPase [Candidatus Limimorpha sp.]